MSSSRRIAMTKRKTKGVPRKPGGVLTTKQKGLNWICLIWGSTRGVHWRASRKHRPYILATSFALLLSWLTFLFDKLIKSLRATPDGHRRRGAVVKRSFSLVSKWLNAKWVWVVSVRESYFYRHSIEPNHRAIALQILDLDYIVCVEIEAPQPQRWMRLNMIDEQMNAREFSQLDTYTEHYNCAGSLRHNWLGAHAVDSGKLRLVKCVR